MCNLINIHTYIIHIYLAQALFGYSGGYGLRELSLRELPV